MSDCVFCKIVARAIPAMVAYEDEHVICFMDVAYVNPGHALVVLKQHAPDIYSVTDEQARALFGTAARVARAIRDTYSPQGLSVYQANGTVAGQQVFHFHIHLIPRREGDGVVLHWPRQTPTRDELETAARTLRLRLDSQQISEAKG